MKSIGRNINRKTLKLKFNTVKLFWFFCPFHTKSIEILGSSRIPCRQNKLKGSHSKTGLAQQLEIKDKAQNLFIYFIYLILIQDAPPIIMAIFREVLL